MFSNNRNFPKVIVAAALTGSLLVGGTVALAADSRDGEAPVRSAQSLALEGKKATTAVPNVEPAITQSFRLFREQAAEPMPAEVAAQVGSPARFGRNPQLARKVKTVTGDGWVIPGNGWICIAIPDPVDSYATSCQPTEVVAARGLYVGLSGGEGIPPGKSAQVALLPDSVAPTEVVRSTTATIVSPGVVTGFLGEGETITAVSGN